MDRTLRDAVTLSTKKLAAVSPSARVSKAVRKMDALHIGSVLVIKEGALEGIFTERDVLQRVVEPGRDPSTTQVSEVMTRNPITVPPDFTVRDTLRLMTAERVRHLPVMRGAELMGIVSIGDLVWCLTSDLNREVNSLHEYIHGPVSKIAI